MAITVLVVEDDPGILRLLVAELEDRGYDTVAASDAEEALPLIDSTRFDAAVIDVRLPGMAGTELVERMKSLTELRSCRTVLISAHGRPPAHHADAFLPKPFDIEDLVNFIG